MRYFEDVPNNEREEMTDEEVERYVALECARRGAPLSPGEPPTPPAAVIIEPDATVYSVGSFEFSDRAEADAVAALIAQSKLADLDYGANYSDRIIGSDTIDPPSVSPRRVFTRVHYEKVKGQLAARETAKKLYEMATDEYKKAAKARDEASSWIWSDIEIARTRKRQRVELREKFRRYLDLAEGDNAIAWNFLEQAHPSVRTEFPELRDALVPVPETAIGG